MGFHFSHRVARSFRSGARIFLQIMGVARAWQKEPGQCAGQLSSESVERRAQFSEPIVRSKLCWRQLSLMPDQRAAQWTEALHVIQQNPAILRQAGQRSQTGRSLAQPATKSAKCKKNPARRAADSWSRTRRVIDGGLGWIWPPLATNYRPEAGRITKASIDERAR